MMGDYFRYALSFVLIISFVVFVGLALSMASLPPLPPRLNPITLDQAAYQFHAECQNVIRVGTFNDISGLPQWADFPPVVTAVNDLDREYARMQMHREEDLGRYWACLDNWAGLHLNVYVQAIVNGVYQRVQRGWMDIKEDQTPGYVDAYKR